MAAREFAASLAVRGRREAYVHYIVSWRLVVSRSVGYLLLRYDTVDFCERKREYDLILPKLEDADFISNFDFSYL